MDKVGDMGMKLAIFQSRAKTAYASKSYRFLAPVIEGVRCELTNGLMERAKKKSRL